MFHGTCGAGLSKHGDPVFPHVCPLNQNVALVRTKGGGGTSETPGPDRHSLACLGELEGHIYRYKWVQHVWCGVHVIHVSKKHQHKRTQIKRLTRSVLRVV